MSEEPEEPLPEGAWWLAVALLYGPLALGSAAWLASSGRLVVEVGGLGAGLLVGAAVAGCTWLLGGLPVFRGMEEALTDLVGSLTLPTIVALALASSVGEELLFRGILQPTWGLVPTAIVFGFVHIPHTRALWPWPFFAFAMGLLLGAMTWWSGELGMAIGAHFAINLLNLHRLTAAEPQS